MPQKTPSMLKFLFLLNLLPLQIIFAEGNERISCSVTQSNGSHYYVTCQDFSQSGTKKIIDCCTLVAGGSLELLRWGQNCLTTDKIYGSGIHLLEAKEPTATYCSAKFSLHKDFLSGGQNNTLSVSYSFRRLISCPSKWTLCKWSHFDRANPPLKCC